MLTNVFPSNQYLKFGMDFSQKSCAQCFCSGVYRNLCISKRICFLLGFWSLMRLIVCWTWALNLRSAALWTKTVCPRLVNGRPSCSVLPSPRKFRLSTELTSSRSEKPRTCDKVCLSELFSKFVGNET